MEKEATKSFIKLTNERNIHICIKSLFYFRKLVFKKILVFIKVNIYNKNY